MRLRGPRCGFALTDWPEEDRSRWNAAFKAGDPFDDCGSAAHIADRTRQALRYHYEWFLGFLEAQYPDVVGSPGCGAARSEDHRPICRSMSQILQRNIQLLIISKSFVLRSVIHVPDQRLVMAFGDRQTHRSSGTPRPERHHLVTSERLYALGIDLMDRAVAGAATLDKPSKAQAFQYRDGLIIALLALIPLRRRTLAALRIGNSW